MGRAAYAVMSHRLPGQLVRLVATLRALSPQAAILVHHDDRQVPAPADELRAAAGEITLVEPVAVQWGRGSQLQMLLAVLRGALAEPDVDWVFLLSGQDYPLRPLAEIEAELRAAPYDGYLEDRQVAPTGWSRGVDEFALRYRYAWGEPPSVVAGPLHRVAAAASPLLASRTLPSGERLMIRRRLRTPFTAQRPLRAGSDWLTLSAPAARRLTELERTRDGRRLLRHFAATLIPTEALPHTVLWADRSLTLSSDVRRFTQWDQAAAHPRIVTAADVPAAIASGADFARKFDDELAPGALDALDAHLGLG